MLIRWRVVGLSLISVLIVLLVAAVFIIPYLHGLFFITADLPPSELARIGHPVHAVLREDQQIDQFGARIQTEANAKAYVGALVKRWLPEANPQLAEFEDRLARAEYAAVRDPNKLIPEVRIADTFNKLLDEWGLSSWPRVTIPELHALRLLYAPTNYPDSVARLPNESIAPRCRPTEALFLLYALDSNGGTPPEIRKQVRDSRFPWSLLQQTKELLSRTYYRPITAGLYPRPWTAEGAIQYAYYRNFRDKYFATHPLNFAATANEIFAHLGIP